MSFGSALPHSPQKSTYLATADSQITIDDILSKLPSDSVNWNTTEYNMIFVLPWNHPEFLSVAQEYAEWKAYLGYNVLILDNYTLFPGRDEPEKLRNTLIYYHSLYPIQWLLIMGDTQLIPIRYIYNPDGQIVNDHEAVGNAYLKPTDFYYADLTGDWNIDGDQYWGEDGKYNQLDGKPEVDYYPELYVGRFPADDVTELQQIVTKTMIYEQRLNPGPWMNRYLAISGISDPANPLSDDADGEDEAILNQYILDTYIEGEMNWTHYMDHTTAYIPPDDPRIEDLSKSSVLNAIDEGQSIIVYAGHGSPSSFYSDSVLTTSDIPNLTNLNMSSFLYGDACSTNAYDIESPTSLGETFLMSPDSGGIGYVGSMRISWYYPNDTALEQDNRGLLKLFLEEMFTNKHFQQGQTLYDSKVAYLESDWFQLTNRTENFKYFEMERKSLFTYMLLGDPTVDIFTDIPQNFQDLGSHLETAYKGSKVKAEIMDEFGNPVPYAKVIIIPSNGNSRTFTTDIEGKVILEFPPNVDSVEYRLIGHNLWIKNGSLDLVSDTAAPFQTQMGFVDPKNPTIQSNATFSVGFDDTESGVLDVFLLLSEDGFTSDNWSYYLMEVDTENQTIYHLEMNGWQRQTYYYTFIARDGVGNILSLYPEFQGEITIEKTVMWQTLFIGTIVIMGVSLLGIITSIFLKSKKSIPEGDFYEISTDFVNLDSASNVIPKE